MEMLPIQMIPVTPAGNSIGSAGSLQTALGLQPGQAVAPAALNEAIPSFQQALAGALQQTNQYSLQADAMVKKLATGEVTDLHKVMIAVEKAGLSLQMTMQVRNKMVEAYQEIMRMQI
jgi:flagellar hook-basal body complex protein FliE